MQALSNFFESINQFLGVSSPGELLFHPAFIGLCLVLFIYATWVGIKYVSLPIGALMGGGIIYHYLWPKGDESGARRSGLGFFGIWGSWPRPCLYRLYKRVRNCAEVPRCARDFFEKSRVMLACTTYRTLLRKRVLFSLSDAPEGVRECCTARSDPGFGCGERGLRQSEANALCPTS